MKKIIWFMLVFTMVRCSHKPSDDRDATGFIVFDDPRHWRFIPAASMNSKNCYDDFKTENLRTGIDINALSMPEYSLIKRTLDTLNIEDLGGGYPLSRHRLKITPVRIKYKLDSKYHAFENTAKSIFHAKVLGRAVQFGYNYIPITILGVEPLYCLDKKLQDVDECECKHDESDSNDFLFKICEYIKVNDRYSDLPCRYHIKGVDTVLFKGQEVIEVSLSCCYLGDHAYFDPITKSIIHMSFGGI